MGGQAGRRAAGAADEGARAAKAAYDERTRLVHSTWLLTTQAELRGTMARYRLRRRGLVGYEADQGYVSEADAAVAEQLLTAYDDVYGVVSEMVTAGLLGSYAQMADPPPVRRDRWLGDPAG